MKQAKRAETLDSSAAAAAELTPTTLGQWPARRADDDAVSTHKTPSQEMLDQLGNDALPGSESEGGSATPTKGPRYGEVPTVEYLEILEAAVAGSELPGLVAPMGKQEEDKGISEAASRFNKIPEEERFQEKIITDQAQGAQPTTSNDHETHKPQVKNTVPAAAGRATHADSEDELRVEVPDDPWYRERPETLFANSHGPRGRIAAATAATETGLDASSEDGAIALSNDPRNREVLMTGDAEGIETAKPQGVAATQQEHEADSEDAHTVELPTNARYHEMLISDHVEGFEIQAQLVQEGSPPHETLASTVRALQ